MSLRMFAFMFSIWSGLTPELDWNELTQELDYALEYNFDWHIWLAEARNSI